MILDIASNIILRVAWSDTYTYLLLFFAAAAFVAFVARPRDRGEAVKRLYAGTLLKAEDIDLRHAGSTMPRLHVHCLGGGKVRLQRLSVANLTESGAISLAVTFKGKDVEIIERDSPGYPDDAPMYGAEFVVDMTGHEWRHVRWVDEDSGLWCAFSLHVREGIDFTVELRR